MNESVEHILILTYLFQKGRDTVIKAEALARAEILVQVEIIVLVELHQAAGQILALVELVRVHLVQTRLQHTIPAQVDQRRLLGSLPAPRVQMRAIPLHNPTPPRADLAPRLAILHPTRGNPHAPLGGQILEGQNEVSLNLHIIQTNAGQAPPRGLDLHGQTQGLRIPPEILSQRLPGDHPLVEVLEPPLQEGKNPQ